MANELIPVGRKLVYGIAEGTPGTEQDPSSNVMYFDAFDADVSEETLERTGLSPEGPGFRPTVGATTVEVSFETEVVFPTITNADAADRPSIHPLLNASLWSLTSDDNDDSHTYVLGSYGNQSSTFHLQEINELNTAYNQTKCIGTVLNTSFEWSSGEKLVCSGDGMAKGFAATGDIDDVFIETASAVTAVTYPDDNPTICTGAVIKVIHTNGSTVYGGGDLATPNNDLVVTSISLDTGVTINAQRGFSAGSAIKRIRAIRDGYTSVSLSLEMPVASDFNPYEIKHDRSTVEINVTLSRGDIATNKCQFLCYGIVTEVAKSDADGRMMWDLTLQLVYPEDSTDSATTPAGRKPHQAFNAGTNKGLFKDPGSALSKGIAVMQFYTA